MEPGRLEEKEKQLEALLGNRPDAYRREPEEEPENGDEEPEEEQKPETDEASKPKLPAQIDRQRLLEAGPEGPA